MNRDEAAKETRPRDSDLFPLVWRRYFIQGSRPVEYERERKPVWMELGAVDYFFAPCDRFQLVPQQREYETICLAFADWIVFCMLKCMRALILMQYVKLTLWNM